MLERVSVYRQILIRYVVDALPEKDHIFRYEAESWIQGRKCKERGESGRELK